MNEEDFTEDKPSIKWNVNLFLNISKYSRKFSFPYIF